MTFARCDVHATSVGSEQGKEEDPWNASWSGSMGRRMTAPGSDDRSLQSLSVDECVELLARRSVGRLAVNVEGEGPLVTPVNYVWSGSAVVFRTDPGTKLDALAFGPISFQVDEIDPIHRSGWSVLVRGRAENATYFESSHLELEPWAGGDKKHWFRIVRHTVTGRRIVLPPFEPHEKGYL